VCECDGTYYGGLSTALRESRSSFTLSSLIPSGAVTPRRMTTMPQSKPRWTVRFSVDGIHRRLWWTVDESAHKAAFHKGNLAQVPTERT
jgi:hypothetical protein